MVEREFHASPHGLLPADVLRLRGDPGIDLGDRHARRDGIFHVMISPRSSAFTRTLTPVSTARCTAIDDASRPRSRKHWFYQSRTTTVSVGFDRDSFDRDGFPFVEIVQRVEAWGGRATRLNHPA